MKGKEYIVRLKISLLKKADNWKEYIYMSYEEIKDVTNDGNYLVEVEDEFKEKIIKEIKNKELGNLHESKSKRSYELLLKVSSKKELDELDVKENFYKEVLKSIEVEIKELNDLKYYVKKLEEEVNIFL